MRPMDHPSLEKDLAVWKGQQRVQRGPWWDSGGVVEGTHVVSMGETVRCCRKDSERI